jgi:hypothetical protein
MISVDSVDWQDTSPDDKRNNPVTVVAMVLQIPRVHCHVSVWYFLAKHENFEEQ